MDYESAGGTSGQMRGYLVRPAGDEPSRRGSFPTVLVIHENRGLNPYIEDVGRRFAVEGFLRWPRTAWLQWEGTQAMMTTVVNCNADLIRASSARTC